MRTIVKLDVSCLEDRNKTIYRPVYLPFEITNEYSKYLE